MKDWWDWDGIKGDVKSFYLCQEDAQVQNKQRRTVKGATTEPENGRKTVCHFAQSVIVL